MKFFKRKPTQIAIAGLQTSTPTFRARILKWFRWLRISPRHTQVNVTSTPDDGGCCGQDHEPLWDRAYNTLRKEKQELVRKYELLITRELQEMDSDGDSSAIQSKNDRTRKDLLNTIIDRSKGKMEESEVECTIRGRTLNVVAELLRWSKSWIDEAVSVSPAASVVWAGVCLVLPLLTNVEVADEANRDGFFLVTPRMEYYVALEPMLSGLWQHLPEQLRREVQTNIVTLYQHILDFQIRSVLRFHHIDFKHRARDALGLDEWKEKLDMIGRLEVSVRQDLSQINELVSSQVSLDNSVSTRKALEILRSSLVMTGEQLKIAGDHRDISQKQLGVQQEQLEVQRELLKKQRSVEEDECLQLFYLTTSDKDVTYEWYKNRVESLVDGTCRWFLDHGSFREWLDCNSKALFVSADPGCGKSVLARYLVDHEISRHGATTICYFFFKDEDQYTLRQALCALLHQLFTQQSHLLRHAMTERARSGKGLVNSTESLWRIWQSALKDDECSSVTVVLDAMDECDKGDSRYLCIKLQEFMEGHGTARYLFTSRPYDHIVAEFEALAKSYPCVRIPGEEESETISEEVNIVVRSQVQKLLEEKRLSPRIAPHLENRLLGIKHRTYLWVHLVFDHLRTSVVKMTETAIDMEIIDNLPENVNQAYDKILCKSKNDPMVRKALCIILAARQPLDVAEMNIAVNMNSEAESLSDIDLEDPADFKSRLRCWCGLFVSIFQGRIYFIHQTAREFLLKDEKLQISPSTDKLASRWFHSITASEANYALAEACIICLDLLKKSPERPFTGGGLHSMSALHCSRFLTRSEYLTRNWYFHLMACVESKHTNLHLLIERALNLCDLRRSLTMRHWSEVLGNGAIDLRHWCQPELELYPNILMTASLFDLSHLVRYLIDTGKADVHEKDYKGRNCLSYASAGGSATMVGFLLDQGVELEEKDVDGRTALSYAFQCKRPYREDLGAAAMLLLERGADITTRDYLGTTMLMFAAEYPTEVGALKYLLEKGVEVNSRNHRGRSALTFAIESGCWDAVPVLLDHGATIEMTEIELLRSRALDSIPRHGGLYDTRYDVANLLYTIRDICQKLDDGEHAEWVELLSSLEMKLSKLLRDAYRRSPPLDGFPFIVS